MSLKCQVVLVWLICLSCKVVMTGCEVVLVKRNVTDSFRVGKDGCTNDTSVCKSNATCQPDGSCLCNSESLSYRNLVLGINGSEIVYGDSYGCIDNEIIRFGAGNASTYCAFRPFHVIPYSHNEAATDFCHDDNSTLLECALYNAWVKFPDNATEMELPWLNESYVHLNVSNKTLHFKWERSVPELQGTIITFNLNCSNSSGSYILRSCLRAKVLGTWPADDASTSTTVQSPSVNMNSTTKPASSDVSPTSSTRFISLGALSSSDDDSSSTIIVIAIVVPAVVLILLVVVVCFCCKRKRRNSQRNPSRQSSEKKNETSTKRPFRHTDSNLRGPNAYVDLPESDTTETFGAHTNPACPTPEKQSVIVEANPSHETVDLQKGEINEVNFYSNPDYEPEDMTKIDEVNASTFISDPDYATVDIKRKKVDDMNSYPEPGYETPDIKRKDVDAKNSYSDPRVNRATSKSNPDYATVDIERKKVDGNNSYTDPGGYATPDVKRKDVDAKNSYSDPGYDGNNSYAESAYETPDIKRKDVDGATSSTDNNYEAIAEVVGRTVKNKDENATTYQQELGYETPDIKRGNINGASSDSTHSIIDSDATKVEENAGYSPANIRRIEINGDLYALPTKKK